MSLFGRVFEQFLKDFPLDYKIRIRKENNPLNIEQGAEGDCK